MEHEPRADEVVGHLAQHQHHLRDEHHHHEREIARADALVHDRLREERQDQAQNAGREHRQRELCKVVFVGPQVLQQITQFQPLVLVAFLAVEGRRRLQKQSDAFAVGKACRKIGRSERGGPLLRAVRQFPALYPCLQELLLGVFEQSRCRIGNIHPPLAAFAGDLVDHHEMLLVPVDDARHVCLVAKLFPCDFDARGTEADRFRGVADPEQRDPFAREVAPLAQILKRVVPPVVLRHDPQRRRPAVHCIELGIVREPHKNIFDILVSYFIHIGFDHLQCICNEHIISKRIVPNIYNCIMGYIP